MLKFTGNLGHNCRGKIDDAVRQKILRIADEWFTGDSPSRDTGLIMIGALFLGPDVKAIARTTKVTPEVVQCVADRLRASGLWTDTDVDYSNWSAGELRGVAAFALDLAVREGKFVRTSKKSDGTFNYKLVTGLQRCSPGRRRI